MFYRGIQKGRVGAALLFSPAATASAITGIWLPLELIVIVVSIPMILWGWLS